MNTVNVIMKKYEKLFDETLCFATYNEKFFKMALEISNDILENYEEMSESYNISYIHNKLFNYMNNCIEFNNL